MPSIFLVGLILGAANISYSQDEAAVVNQTTPIITDGHQLTDVQITKSSSLTYNLIDEASLIGPFNTTYTITGNSSSLIKAKDTITSLIFEDFSSSPTIGYIKAENISGFDDAGNSTKGFMSSIANPFADINTINSTLTKEISNAIESQDTGSSTISIKCNLGMSITNWKCDG